MVVSISTAFVASLALASTTLGARHSRHKAKTHASQHAHKLQANAYSERASNWKLDTSVSGQELLNFFNFETSNSDGAAKYVSQADAYSSSILGIKDNTTYFGVASSPSGGGREAIRVSSKSTYNAGTLFVIDVEHMPTGCGTWPAIWTVAQDGSWPAKGELDIVEGVNEFTTNQLSAHTKSGFDMGTTGFAADFMLQAEEKTNCDAKATNDQGCGLRDPDTTTFGPAFNAAGGGVFVMEWESSHIAMYYFNRSSVPEDVLAGRPAPSSNWGTPKALFKGISGQNTADYFQDHVLVINTNLCGTWPNGVWDSVASYAGQNESCAKSTGYSTCEAYVTSAAKFSDAYWAIKSVQVYS